MSRRIVLAGLLAAVSVVSITCPRGAVAQEDYWYDLYSVNWSNHTSAAFDLYDPCEFYYYEFLTAVSEQNWNAANAAWQNFGYSVSDYITACGWCRGDDDLLIGRATELLALDSSTWKNRVTGDAYNRITGSGLYDLRSRLYWLLSMLDDFESEGCNISTLEYNISGEIQNIGVSVGGVWNGRIGADINWIDWVNTTY